MFVSHRSGAIMRQLMSVNPDGVYVHLTPVCVCVGGGGVEGEWRGTHGCAHVDGGA